MDENEMLIQDIPFPYKNERTASVIDTMPFPYLDEFDLNLWIDDDNFLRVVAYQLCLTESDELDEDGNKTYQMDNQGCADPISLMCVHYDDYSYDDREAIFADLTDEWNTVTGFLSDAPAWVEKYPDFYAYVCEAIKEELMDDFGAMESYEACQHPYPTT